MEYVIPAINVEQLCMYDIKGEYINVHVKLQHNNIPMYIIPSEIIYMMHNVSTPGLVLSLYFQPPCSPKLNILQIAMFNSIQADYICIQKYTMGMLIDMVAKAFCDYSV